MINIIKPKGQSRNNPNTDGKAIIDRNIWSLFKLLKLSQLSLAMLMLVIVSGFMLAFNYDLRQPSDSIQLLLIANPAAAFIRSFHYWSAQGFFIASLYHLVEMVYKDYDKRLSFGQWLRSILVISFIYLAMFSGFLLKADQEAQLARSIAQGLIFSLPWGQDLLHFLILGIDHDWQIIYMHHISSSSLIIVVIYVDHSMKALVRHPAVKSRIWPQRAPLIWSTILILAISWIWPISLANNQDLAHKGPWYAMAIQEFLHWGGHPLWFWFIYLFLNIQLLLLPLYKGNRQAIKWLLFAIFSAYMIMTATAHFFRGPFWQWSW